MSSPSNKYKSLISNTILFGISTFGSKVLSFVLRPVYSRLMDPGVLGAANLIVSTCNLILPVMYLCIAEAVIRFGMEPGYKRSDVFSTGIFTVVAGWAVLWCFYPILSGLDSMQGYTWLVYLYCIASALRTCITSFVRVSGLVRLFAIDGIFTTVVTVALNLVFLMVLDMGVVGYVLSTVCADAISALFLFGLLRLHRFLKVRGIDQGTFRDMFRYAIPLIPTAVAWWVTNLSDQFFIRHFEGEYMVGLYTANNLPAVITLVSTFFTRAWEMSAFAEYKSKEGARFFSNVFRSYYTFVFLAASGLILLLKPYTALFEKKYAESWRYAPFLILAVSFSCLVTFLGAVYNAERKNLMVTVTTVLGAVANIVLNALLIPRYGPQGAAFATFVSFFLVFLIRAVDTRRYIRIRMQPARIAFSLALLLLQVWVALSEGRYWILWECLIFGALLVTNFGYILLVLRRLMTMVRRRRRA